MGTFLNILSLLPINHISDDVLLILSLATFIALLVSRAEYKYGIPVLLLFLGVGMLFGADGFGIRFDNFEYAQFVGNVALTIILLSGGFTTDYKEIRPILKEGIALSTLGVLFTTMFSGAFILLLSYWMPTLLPFGLLTCFLLAAVMSSTDSASVFSILKGSKIKLKENLRPILELESGSNDPMAYVLTIILTQTIIATQAASYSADSAISSNIILTILLTLVMQILIGTVAGFGMGFFTRWMLRKVKLKESSLYAILILSIIFITNSLATMLKGNGLLALYICAIIIGNDKEFTYKREVSKFFDGLTWLVQLMSFLLLGLLVNPHELLNVAFPAILIAIFISLIARPASVFIITYRSKRLSYRGKTLISWVGLKGAAPILFSIYPVIAGIDESLYIFNIVFFVTLVSLIVQGMTIPYAANILRLKEKDSPEHKTYGVEIPEQMGNLIEIVVTDKELRLGNTLAEIGMPQGKRVLLIKRGKQYIIPHGNTQIMRGDRLVTVVSLEKFDNLAPK